MPFQAICPNVLFCSKAQAYETSRNADAYASSASATMLQSAIHSNCFVVISTICYESGLRWNSPRTVCRCLRADNCSCSVCLNRRTTATHTFWNASFAQLSCDKIPRLWSVSSSRRPAASVLLKETALGRPAPPLTTPPHQISAAIATSPLACARSILCMLELLRKGCL